MKRREYLVGGSLIATSLLIAGCTDQSNANADGPEETESEGTPVEEHLDVATDAMENAVDAIEVEAEKFTSSSFEEGGVDVQTETITEYLDTAESRFDKAKSDATDDQAERIETAISFIAVLRDMTEFLDTFAEGYTQASSGFTYIESERYADAEEQLVTSEETLSTAEEGLTVMQGSLSEIDKSEIDGFDAISLTEFENDVENMAEMMPALVALVEGMKYFSRGSIDLQEANAAYDSEQYSTAETEYRDASNDYGTAHSVFKEQEDEAPSAMKSSFIELTCQASALQDGCRHLANGTEAIRNGNQARAEEEFTEAEEALDRCNTA